MARTGAISYSTLLGGGGYDSADALTVDTAGHAYITGQTYSTDYPLLGTLEGFSGITRLAGAGVSTTRMAFVTKLNKQGTALWYSTYLGGSGGDSGAGIGVDGIGDVWATGPTGSLDFLTLRPHQATLNNVAPGGNQSGSQDAFVSFIDNTTRHFTYGYDGLQRLTGVTETLGNAYGYGYDAVGNRTAVVENGVPLQQDGYDAADEIITATTPQGTTQDSYDAAGNLTGDAATSYSYDALDRLTALTATAQQAQTTTYTYNGDGTLVAQSSNGTTTRYTQDAAANPDPGQGVDAQTLAAATPDAALVDTVTALDGASGAQAMSDPTGDSTSAAGTSVAADTSSSDPAALGAGSGIPADTTSAAFSAGASVPSVGSTFGAASPVPAPDAASGQAALPVAPLLPAQPTTVGPVPTTGGTNAGLSQVLQTTQQTSQGTSAPVDYLYGVARLASTSALNPQAHVWYVADLQGSVRYTQDDTGGSGQSLNYDPVPPRYDPYGTIDRGADGDGVVAQPFAYRGELQDAQTGLVDLRARMYNPASGQFLQRDPLEQQTGQAYAYANGNPVNQSDPSGLFGIPGFEQAPGAGGGNASKDAIISDFVRYDRPGYDLTSINRSGPFVVKIPSDSPAHDIAPVGVADIIRLDPHPVNGRFQGEVYAVVPDTRNVDHQAQIIEGYPLPQLYALINQARRTGLPLLAPSGVSQNCATLAPLDLRLGTSYATSDGGGAQGPTRYQKYATLIDATPAYPIVFGAQLQPGIIAYSQCRRGANDLLPCQPPQQDACEKATNHNLCVLDLFALGGNLNKLRTCVPNDTGCHVASSIGIADNAALTVLSFGTAGLLRGLSIGAREEGLAADTARGIEAGITDQTVTSITINGETRLLTPTQARAFLAALEAGEIFSGRTLLLGEGDFSFARSIVETGQVDPKDLVATSYDSFETLTAKSGYENAAANINALRRQGTIVLDSTNATALNAQALGKFDNVVFNFPHPGTFLPNPSLGNLLTAFFRSVPSVLQEDGLVYVTLKKGQGYPGEEALRRYAGSNLTLVGTRAFDFDQYPGYGHVQTKGGSSVEFPQGATTYIFRRSR